MTRAEARKVMTLGDFIDALETCDQARMICLEDGRLIGDFLSYRGDYSHLAICSGSVPTTVGEVLEKARAAVGAKFVGYKGGDFVMRRDTPLWVSNYGDCDNLRPCGLKQAERVIVELVDVGQSW